jgi:hypothetical protein
MWCPAAAGIVLNLQGETKPNRSAHGGAWAAPKGHCTARQTRSRADRQTDKQTNKQTNKQINKQTKKQADQWGSGTSAAGPAAGWAKAPMDASGGMAMRWGMQKPGSVRTSVPKAPAETARLSA